MIYYRDLEGRLKNKSSGTTDKATAKKLAGAMQQSVDEAKKGLSTDRARAIMANFLDGLTRASTGEGLDSAALRQWLVDWLAGKDGTVRGSTLSEYRAAVRDIEKTLSGQLDKPVEALTVKHCIQFRDAMKSRTSTTTANKKLKILRVILGDARKAGLTAKSPAADCPTYEKKESARRGFTLEEITRLLDCTKGTGWHGMILLGFFTGQRLNDLTSLRWNQIDLERGEIAFHQQKTGKRLRLPLHKAALDWLMGQAGDDPDGLVFPDIHGRNASGLFHGVMVSAGLAQPRGHAKTKNGRGAKRELSDLSFHSLRHSAATMLRATGATDVLARAVLGHESAEVARQYTHLQADDLRGAVNSLPDPTQRKNK